MIRLYSAHSDQAFLTGCISIWDYFFVAYILYSRCSADSAWRPRAALSFVSMAVPILRAKLVFEVCCASVLLVVSVSNSRRHFSKYLSVTDIMILGRFFFLSLAGQTQSLDFDTNV